MAQPTLPDFLTPPRLPPRSVRTAVGVDGGSINPAMVALGVYLWVIHSQKVPLAQPAILVGLAAVLAMPGRLQFPGPLLWFGGFVAWAGVSALASPDSAQAIDGAWDYLKLWVIFFIAANTARTPRQLRAFMIMWLGIFALYPVRGTLFNLVSGISTQNRYAWNFIFSNPNDLATLTLPMLAMVIVFLPLERGWTRWAARIGAVLLPAIVVATQSRAGILALGVMVTGFILNARRGSAPRRRRVRSHRLAYLTIATLAAIGIAVAAPQGVWERLKGLRGLTGTENLQQVDVEGSAEQRFEIWRVSWAIAADHPFFGVGPGIYPVAHANYASRSEFKPIARGQRDTHSMYFNALAEGGLPALALLLGMISSVFTGLARGITRADPAWPEHVGTLRVLGIGFIGFLVASAFATMQHIAFLYLYIAVITSAVALGPPAAAKPARPFPQPRRSR